MVSSESGCFDAQVISICGTQWGDEGKGKYTALFSEHFDYVARFNGGANAGHSVVHNGKLYKFRMLPCGALHEHVKCIIGTGCTVSLEILHEDIKNVPYPLESIIKRLFISNRAHLVFSVHVKMDKELENFRSSIFKKIGTTSSGIGPTCSTKALRTGIRMGDLLDFEHFKTIFNDFIYFSKVENLITKEEIEEQLAMYQKFHNLFKSCIINTSLLITDELKLGKRILIECNWLIHLGANGVLLDIDHGTYPYVTSTNTFTSSVYIHLGIPFKTPILNVGIVKAYQTRVGEGPFPTELKCSSGDMLRDHGKEFGTVTKRSRRCGWIDLPSLRYSNALTSFDYLILTKLDVLSGFDEIKICVDYKINGNKHFNQGLLMTHGDYPASMTEYKSLEPVYETVKGWGEDITMCRKFEDLPEEAKKYINRISELVQIPIKIVGIGQSNEHTIYL